MTTRKRISLLVTITLLSSAVVANTSGVQVMSRGGVAKTNQSGVAATMVKDARYNQVKKALETSPSFKNLPPSTVAGLLAGYQNGNKTIQKAIDEGLRLDAVANSALYSQIVALKLEILDLTAGSMDIHNPQSLSGLQNANKYRHYMIVKAVAGMEAYDVLDDAKRRIILFLTELRGQVANIGMEEAGQALENALEGYNAQTGIGLSVHDLEFGIAPENEKNGGIKNLFLSDGDVQPIKIGTKDGTELEIRMTPNEVKSITEAAKLDFIALIQMVSNPNGQSDILQKLRPPVMSAMEKFLDQSDLLKRPDMAFEKGKKTGEVNVQNYDDLLLGLKELGDIIDGDVVAGKLSRVFDSKYLSWIPGTSVAAKHFSKKDLIALKKMSIEKKIAAAKKAVEDGNQIIQQDNQDLNKTRALANDYILALKADLVRFKLLTDYVRDYIASIQQAQPQLAQAIQINVSLQLESELDAVLAKDRILKSLIKRIDVTIESGMRTVARSEMLTKEVLPMLKINEGILSATAAQKAQMQRDAQVMSLYKNRQDKLDAAIMEAMDLNVAAAKQSMYEPEEMRKREEAMALAIAKYKAGMAEAQQLRAARNDEGVKSYNASGEDVGAGNASAVNKIIKQRSTQN